MTKVAGWSRFGRHKYDNFPLALKFAFPVTSSCSLGNGVQPRQCAIHDREIHINPRLDKLRTNNTYGLTSFQSCFDLGNEIGAMLTAQKS